MKRFVAAPLLLLTVLGPLGCGSDSNQGKGNGGSAGTAMDSAGSAGTPAQAGQGGAGGSGAPSVDCDDANVCTTDSAAEDGSCVHEAVAEGTSCDDDRSCTENDVCQSGTCGGQPRTSSAAVLGRLHSFCTFSQSPDKSTLAAFLSDTRAIFADSGFSKTILTLADISGDRVVPIARATSNLRISRLQISAWIWAERPGAQLVPLGATRFALVAGGQSIEVFDAATDQLQLLNRYSLGGSDATVHAAASTSDRIWLCTSRGVQGYVVAADGKVNSAGDVAGIAPCNGIALSPDGGTLYAAASGGLDLLTVEADGSATPREVRLRDTMVFNVRALGPYVAAQSMLPQLGFGPITVFDAASGAVVATFASDTAAGQNMGFELVDGGIVLQRYGFLGTGQRLISAQYFKLPLSGSAAAGTLGLMQRFVDPELTNADIVQLTARGTKLITQPLGRLLRVDAATGQLAVVPGMQQGSFERVFALDSERVLAAGPFSAHVLDVSTPATPRALSGAAHAADVEAVVLLGDASRSEWQLASVRSRDLEQHLLQTSADRIRLLDASTNQPVFSGSLLVDGGPAHLLPSRADLFVVAPGDGQFRVTRRSLHDVPPNAQDVSVVAEDWGTLTNAGPAATRLTSDVAINKAGTDLVLLDVESLASSTLVSRINWYTRSGAGFVHVAGLEQELPDRYGRLHVFGDHVATFIGREARLFRRSGAELQQVAHYDFGAFPENSAIDQILHLDEEFLYVAATRYSLFEDTSTPEVVALRVPDLTLAARYDTEAPAVSLAKVGGSVALGSPDEVVLVAPACR